MPSTVRGVIRDIGYTDPHLGFDFETAAVLTSIDEQSGDIAMGVDTGGAGDQGMMFGFACTQTDVLMPMPIVIAHRLVRRLAEVRKAGVVDYLKPDGKSQVTIEYEDHIPKRIDTVLVSTQHSDGRHDRPDPQGPHEGGHPAGRVGDERGRERLPHPRESDGALREGRPRGRHGAHGPQDHRRHVRRLREPRRRRLLGEGSDEGRPLRLATRRATSRRTSWARGSPTSARCRSPTRSAWPSRSRS